MIDEKRMEFVECLNDMWKSFLMVATPKDKEAYVKFIEAKEKAHNLLAEIVE